MGGSNPRGGRAGVTFGYWTRIGVLHQLRTGNPIGAALPLLLGVFSASVRLGGSCQNPRLKASWLASSHGSRYARRVPSTPLPPTEITALLGRGTQFEGKLLFDGRVRVDGSFTGTIRSDGTLIIGEGAEVDAEIDVTNVIIRGGSVRGAIRARSSIELYVPARVAASLHAPSVFIDKGVHFEGTCKMAPIEDPAQGGQPLEDAEKGDEERRTP